jgi:putative Mg2+ transporter-C (MgtC) family protein
MPLPISEIFLRYLVGSIISWVVGYERYAHGRPAGLRTHMLVCLASVTLMLVSIEFIFYMPEQLDNLFRVDPGRIAAGAITGIGFIGAGVIVKMERNIHGLTTAASLWMMAAIGLAVGAGMYAVGITAFGATLVSLAILRRVEKLFSKRDFYRNMIVKCQGIGGFMDDIKPIFAECNLDLIRRSEEIDLENDIKTYNFMLHATEEKTLNRAARKIAELESVLKVTIGSVEI